MNKEDIIRMALEAELIYDEECSSPWMEDTNLTPFLERFAALVASAERERFADECIDLVASYGGPVDLEAAIRLRGQP